MIAFIKGFKNFIMVIFLKFSGLNACLRYAIYSLRGQGGNGELRVNYNLKALYCE